jgi:hypothetical protein
VTAPDAPLDTTQLTRVGGQLGSNPGGVYEDARGKRYYVKTLESKAHAQSERIAARLYQLAGAPTLHYVPTLAPDQIATELVTLQKRRISSLSEAERKEAQRWLGVHAFTANWDAAGFEGDNQGVVDGTVTTLDVGGALDFRGQGYPKGKAFGTGVGELDTLRTEPDNPYAVRLFGDMGPDDVRAAIGVVTRIADEAIRAVVLELGGKHALADKLIARKADMARRLERVR